MIAIVADMPYFIFFMNSLIKLIQIRIIKSVIEDANISCNATKLRMTYEAIGNIFT